MSDRYDKYRTSELQSVWNYLKASAVLLRIHDPTGWILLGLPGSWLFSISDKSYAFWGMWWLGALCARGAGCVINDYCDRDLDRQVTRTQHRPLASGVLRGRDALYVLGVMAVAGYCCAYALGGARWVYLATCCVPWICAYPYAKRCLPLPQLFLAPVFASSVWFAAGLDHAPQAGLWYAATVFWIMGYDSVYACADLEDDKKIAIYSAPKTLKKFIYPFIFFCYSVFLLAVYFLCSIRGASVFIYVFLCFLCFKQIDWAKKNKAIRAFRSNVWVGVIVKVLLWLS